MLITIHKRTPKNSDFIPTVFIAPLDMDAPIKNIVKINNLRAILDTNCPN